MISRNKCSPTLFSNESKNLTNSEQCTLQITVSPYEKEYRVRLYPVSKQMAVELLKQYDLEIMFDACIIQTYTSEQAPQLAHLVHYLFDKNFISHENFVKELNKIATIMPCETKDLALLDQKLDASYLRGNISFVMYELNDSMFSEPPINDAKEMQEMDIRDRFRKRECEKFYNLVSKKLDCLYKREAFPLIKGLITKLQNDMRAIYLSSYENVFNTLFQRYEGLINTDKLPSSPRP